MSDEERYEKYYASKGLSQDDFNAIIAKDPTAKKGLAGPMSDWMINRYLEGQFNLSELDEVAFFGAKPKDETVFILETQKNPKKIFRRKG